MFSRRTVRRFRRTPRQTFGRARRTNAGRAFRSTRATVPLLLPRAEVKQVSKYASISSANIVSGVPYQTQMTLPAQGTTSITREGNVIKTINYKLDLSFTNLGATPSYNMRVIVFEWLQGYVSPSYSEILDNSAGGDYIMAPYNQLAARNFRILYDKVYFTKSPTIGNAATFSPQTVVHNAIIRCPRIVTFNGTASNDGDHMCYLLLMPDGLSSAGVSATYTIACKFIDV